MSATLQLHSITLAYGDPNGNNNPSLRHFDWKRSLTAIPVRNPKSEELQVPAGEEIVVFDGSRTTAIDETTEFGISMSPLDPSRYRISSSQGTSPEFRADRALDLAGVPLTLAVNANGTLTLAAGAGAPFVRVQAGDHVLVLGPTTGDPGQGFNPTNEGRWLVLGRSDTVLTLVRPPGESFSGVSEFVTPADGGVLVYSSAGVQVGDKVDISAGFSASVLRTYEVVSVTPRWFEIVATSPLPIERGLPGAAGMLFYSGGKRFLRVESDQDCVVRCNGDTSTSNRLSPWAPGDEKMVSEYVRVGPTWALKILNRSTAPATVRVISAE